MFSTHANFYWTGNLSRSRSEKKHRPDLEMVRGSLRSSIGSTRHLVAKRCRPLGNLWLQECGGTPWHHRWPQEACFQFREIVLYYVAFISVAFISCFLIRCFACDYILFTGNSETNSLLGLTAGNARQLWQLDGMSKSPPMYLLSAFWPGVICCARVAR